MMKLNEYTIKENELIINALIKINENKKGFLIVTNAKGNVVGTLTDGDIRRYTIANKSIDSPISTCYNKTFYYIRCDEDFSHVLDIFKEQRISFIPVLNDDNNLVNIVTKRGLQTILLQDIQLNLSLDFLSVDESMLEHEIYKRPWGFYKTTVLNDTFQSKIISVAPKGSLSFQMHRHREEHWVIIKGEGEIRLENSFIKVEAGDYMFIPKGCKHRIMNRSGKETLIFMEVQLGQYFGEDDIIRFEDDYGRVVNEQQTE